MGRRREEHGRRSQQLLIDRTGDIGPPHVEAIARNIGLVPGNLALSRFEDLLPGNWPKCLDEQEAESRVTTAFRHIMRQAAASVPADLMVETDPVCLALLKHYRSLMPLAMGAHVDAVRACHDDFPALARRTADKSGFAVA